MAQNKAKPSKGLSRVCCQTVTCPFICFSHSYPPVPLLPFISQHCSSPVFSLVSPSVWTVLLLLCLCLCRVCEAPNPSLCLSPLLPGLGCHSQSVTFLYPLGSSQAKWLCGSSFPTAASLRKTSTATEAGLALV